MIKLIKKISEVYIMKKCSICGKIYMDYDHYCLVCNRRLEYIEGSEKFEYYPNETGTVYGETNPIVRCPYCHSDNTSKIPKKSLFISDNLFGGGNLSEVGKNFHCNKCGADF